MHSAELINEFLRIFPADDAVNLIKALQQDQLIWGQLQTPETFIKFQDMLGNKVQRWKPANFAWVILGQVSRIAGNYEIDNRSSEIKRTANRLLEKVINSEEIQKSFYNVSLLALASTSLFQDQKLSWKEIISELLFAKDKYSSDYLPFWQSVFSCLYLSFEETEFIELLLESANPEYADQILVKSILLNHINKKESLRILFKSMSRLDLARKVRWIRLLEFWGRDDLSMIISKRLVDVIESDNEKSLKKNPSIPELFFRIMEDYNLASIYQSAGKPEGANNILLTCKRNLEYLGLGLNIKLFENAANSEKESDLSAFSQKLQNGILESSDLLTDPLEFLYLDWGKLGKIDEKLVRFKGDASTIMAWLSILAGKNPANKKHQLQEFLNNGGIFSDEQLKLPQFLHSSSPLALIKYLSETGFQEIALQVCEDHRKKSPLDFEANFFLGKMYIESGEFDKAIDPLENCIVVKPDDPELKRMAANAYDAAGNWSMAYEHRQKFLEINDSLDESELLAHVEVAVKLQKWNTVLICTEKILEFNPNHGEAAAYRGLAYYHLQNPKEATANLSRATFLTPEMDMPWLLLASIYKEESGYERAIETLLSGVRISPKSVKLNVAVGEEYIKNGLLSEGLLYIKKAAELEPESREHILTLSRVYKTLNDFENADYYLSEARKVWNEDYDLTLLHAQVLALTGNNDAAVQAFEMAQLQESLKIEDVLIYVQTLLGYQDSILEFFAQDETKNLRKAYKIIKKLCSENKDSFTAQILLAELTTLGGDIEDAVNQYQILLENPLSQKPEFYWRIQAGFGYSALKMGEVEASLAAVKEAANENSDLIWLYQLLAAVYYEANLKEEAFQIAKIILSMSPDDAEILYWFVDFVIRLDDEKAAIKVLVQLIEKQPQNVTNYSKLAQIYKSLGEMEQALDYLNQAEQVKKIQPDDLIEIAGIYLDLDQVDRARECLERAGTLVENKDIYGLFKISCLYKKINDIELAFVYSQKVIDYASESPLLYIYQSDLLVLLGRPQASLSCVEHAKLLLENDHYQILSHSIEFKKIHKVFPETWIDMVSNQAGILMREAVLYSLLGRHSDAFSKAYSALEIVPEDLSAVYLAANLASEILDFESLKKLLEHYRPGQSKRNDLLNPKLFFNEKSTYFGFRCFLAEYELATGNDQQTSNLIYADFGADELHPRLLCLKARQKQKEGNILDATAIMEAAESGYDILISKAQNHNDVSNLRFGFDLVSVLDLQKDYWMADALLAVGCWDDAIKFYEELAARNSESAKANLVLAKAYIVCAEKQRFFDELECVRHAPGYDKISETAFIKFMQTIEKAKKLTRFVEDVDRWDRRGKSVFHLSQQTIKEFGNYVNTDDDLSVLIASLRQINNSRSALEIIKRLPEMQVETEQMALCYKTINVGKGLELAENKINNFPNDPKNYIVYAILCLSDRNPDFALRSVETALSFWDDEPKWHAWAAMLALKLFDYELALVHFEKAYELDRKNPEYALELAKVYLKAHHFEQAINILNHAAQLQPERSDLWLYLASAYQEVKDFNKALSCVDKARKIEPESTGPLLAAGELSESMGKMEAALDYAKMVIDREPDNEDGLLFLSGLLEKQGLIKESLNVLQQTAGVHDVSIKFRLKIARLLLQLNDYPAVLPYLKELEIDNPLNIEVKILLAETLAANGEHQEAEMFAHDALRINPEADNLLMLLGKLKKGSGHLDQAVHYLSEVINKNPKEIDAYLLLGETYQERREYKMALDTYKKAIKSMPNDFRPFYQAGLMLRELRDYLEAETMLRRAADLAPEDLNIRRQLGAVVALNLVHNSREKNYRL